MNWKLTFIIAGLGLIVLAGWLAEREHTWLRSAQIVPGTVVKIVYFHSGGRGSSSYQPHVRYTARDGITREFVPYTHSSAGVVVKEQVVVAYDDAKQSARMVTFGLRYGLDTFLAVTGAALAVLGAALLAGRPFMLRFYPIEAAFAGR